MDRPRPLRIKIENTRAYSPAQSKRTLKIYTQFRTMRDQWKREDDTVLMLAKKSALSLTHLQQSLMLNQNIRMGVYDIISELNLSQNAGAYIIWTRWGEPRRIKSIFSLTLKTKIWQGKILQQLIYLIKVQKRCQFETEYLTNIVLALKTTQPVQSCHCNEEYSSPTLATRETLYSAIFNISLRNLEA